MAETRTSKATEDMDILSAHGDLLNRLWINKLIEDDVYWRGIGLDHDIETVLAQLWDKEGFELPERS